MSSAVPSLNSSLLDDSGVDSFVVASEQAGWRVDKLLAYRYSSLHSRSYFQQLIARGLVTINDTPLVKKRTLLAEGSHIEVHFEELPPPDIIAEPLPLTIVYEDEEIVVIDKAAGMVVHPAPGHVSGTLVNALYHHCRETPLWHTALANGELRAGIVHRLDKDTSGLLVAAKTSVAHQRLVTAFASRHVKKEYLAVCLGNPGARTITGAIARHPRDRQKMAIVTGGREALTHCRTLYTNKGVSVVVAAPHTGRTHQIRVHLQSVGTPIVGDALYGSSSYNEKIGAKRQLLHAWQLSFPHPLSGVMVAFTAPPPADFSPFLAAFIF